MSPSSSKHDISLHYQVRTSRTGYREIERLLPFLGEFQNAVIRHQHMLARLAPIHRQDEAGGVLRG